MANIGLGFRRFIGLGCTHGNLINEEAAWNALAFAADWDAETRIHLGDHHDFAALRTGAKGTSDEGADLSEDLYSGNNFLEEFQPTILFDGNHDERVYRLADGHNAIAKQAARSIIDDLDRLTTSLGCLHIKDYRIGSKKSRYRLGDTEVFHGWMFNTHAITDHALRFGKCLFAHLHIVGQSTAVRSDAPTGYCVGSLADFSALDYAQRRPSTLRWKAGIAFGEYNDKETRIWLSEADENNRFHFPLK